eukprot:snap_masked-scaffold_1-processed-gene-15.16-mRNA-1 protein AED:1.00 eAED:1.00 QI:0/-1/0/0/-1/1/1/0/773
MHFREENKENKSYQINKYKQEERIKFSAAQVFLTSKTEIQSNELKFLQNTQLVRLNLSRCGLNQTDLLTVFKGKRLVKLIDLDLSENSFYSPAVTTVFELSIYFLKLENLQRLDLSCCKLGKAQVNNFLKAFIIVAFSRKFELRNCNFSRNFKFISPKLLFVKSALLSLETKVEYIKFGTEQEERRFKLSEVEIQEIVNRNLLAKMNKRKGSKLRIMKKSSEDLVLKGTKSDSDRGLMQKLKLMKIVQDNDAALLQNHKLYEQVQRENEESNLLSLRISSLQDKCKKEIKSLKYVQEIWSDKYLFNKLKDVDSLQSLNVVNGQLKKRAEKNSLRIADQKQMLEMINKERDSVKKVFQDILVEGEKIRKDNQQLKELNREIKGALEEKTKMLALSEKKQGEMAKKEVKQFKASFQKEENLLRVLQDKVNLLSDENQGLRKEITNLRTRMIREKVDLRVEKKDIRGTIAGTGSKLLLGSRNFGDFLNKGGIFNYKEKYSLFWKYPKFVYLSEDLKYLCISNGNQKGIGVVTKFHRNCVKLRGGEAKEMADVVNQALAARSKNSPETRQRRASTSTLKQYFKVKDEFRTLRLTLYESKTLGSEETFQLPLNLSNFTLKKVYLKAESEEVKQVWEDALTWWITTGKAMSPDPCSPVSSPTTQQTKSQSPLSSPRKTTLKKSLNLFLKDKNSPGDALRQLKDTPEDEDENMIRKLKEVISQCVASSKENDSLTYKAVRESVEQRLKVDLKTEKWKEWLRYQVDDHVRHAESESEDSQL